MRPGLTTRLLKYILLASVVIAIITILIWLGYLAPWTGFGDYTKPNSDFVRGKTLWDWMQLFIIPIFLSIGVFMLNRLERDTEREIAADRQRETALQSYLDRMTDLLLKNKLRTTKDEQIRDVARVRTITALRTLDAKRNRIVVRFLTVSGLVNLLYNGDLTHVDMQGVNFRDANLSGRDAVNVTKKYQATIKRRTKKNVDMSGVKISEISKGIDLSNSNLQKADFSRAVLDGAILREADFTNASLDDATVQNAKFRKANLEEASLTGANLYAADLSECYMKKANLSSANLNSASLEKADLRDAILTYANLSSANLRSVNLRRANLKNADLTNADLQDAKVSKEQLTTARSLQGATLPDGKKHD